MLLVVAAVLCLPKNQRSEYCLAFPSLSVIMKGSTGACWQLCCTKSPDLPLRVVISALSQIKGIWLELQDTSCDPSLVNAQVGDISLHVAICALVEDLPLLSQAQRATVIISG